MAIFWSDDCLACLCNLPHSVEQHDQAVQRAYEELQAQLTLLKHEIMWQDSLLFDNEDDDEPTD